MCCHGMFVLEENSQVIKIRGNLNIILMLFQSCCMDNFSCSCLLSFFFSSSVKCSTVCYSGSSCVNLKCTYLEKDIPFSEGPYNIICVELITQEGMVGLGRDYEEKIGLSSMVWILGGKCQFFIFFLPLEG